MTKIETTWRNWSSQATWILSSGDAKAIVMSVADWRPCFNPVVLSNIYVRTFTIDKPWLWVNILRKIPICTIAGVIVFLISGVCLSWVSRPYQTPRSTFPLPDNLFPCFNLNKDFTLRPRFLPKWENTELTFISTDQSEFWMHIHHYPY